MIKQLFCAAILAASLNAHGGQYRGPGDVVPPGGGRTGRPSGPTTGGPAGPTTGGPAGPSAPRPAGPATGGPGNPGGGSGRAPTTGGRGVRIGDDLSKWAFWWEFNKDPFIKLRDSLYNGGPQTGSDDFYLGSTRKNSKDTQLPTKKDKIDILAALKKAIESTNNKDVVSSCMIAMAKIGDIHPDFKLYDVFKPRLKSKNQEIRETAILAMGIAATDEAKALELLIQTALGKEIK